MDDILQYDEPVFRPPSEAGALIIQVTIGCSNNQCTFCEMYTSKKFHTRSLKDIERDLKTAARFYKEPRRIFLADGDALVLPADKLGKICDMIHDIFPHRLRISAYANPRNILVKSEDDLKKIREAGISLIYVGLESGSDVVLSKVKKGVIAKEIEESLLKAKEAGLKTSVTWILGLGGKKYSKEHAQETAKVLSRCGTTYTSALTLMLPFGPNRLKKSFPEWEELSPIETLEELKIFAENYNGSPTIFRSNHASNYLPVKATLPEGRDELVNLLDKAINNPDAYLRAEWMRGL